MQDNKRPQENERTVRDALYMNFYFIGGSFHHHRERSGIMPVIARFYGCLLYTSGNIYWGIDEDIRDRLRSRLMRAVLSFKV